MVLRKDIPLNKKWKVEDIFASDSEWENEYNYLTKNSDFSRYKGKLSKDSELLDFLRKTDEFCLKLGLVEVYAMMRKDEDSSNSKYTSMEYKADNLAAAYSSGVSFATPEITEFSIEKLNGLKANPLFSDYDRFFDGIIKNKEHILSAETEKVLALGSTTYRSFRNIFDMADNVDFPFPQVVVRGEKVTLSHGAYGVLLADEDRLVRRKAFKSYYKAYEKLLNIISANYVASVNKDVFLAKARNYPSALSKALSSEEVKEGVYSNLLNCVNNALPVLHDYVVQRKKELCLSKMHMYDMYVSLVADCKIEYEYEDAYKIVVQGLKVLGQDYVDLLERAYRERWIDVEENYGKRSGAYSVGVYGIKHPFVLLNYKKTAHNLFTIAHEMGHSIHTYFSNKNQPQPKSDYTIFVAEVASTVNEVLLLRYLLSRETDVAKRKYYLNYFLEMFRTTLFRQTMFAEFEFEVHSIVENGGALSKESMNEIYLNLNKKYYGKDVVSDREISFEWARIPHFYSAFYVYKYATGIISAVTIADKILSGEENAVENYFKFLSSGCSDTPVNLLKIAGVDLETKQPYEKAMDVFYKTLKEFIILGEENGAKEN